MAKHIVFRIVAGLVLLAVLAGIAFFAYNAGVMHGAALDIKTLTTPAEGQPPLVPMYAHGMVFHHAMPFFGFGCFGLLIPLFLFFLAFAALRHLLWGPRWGWGGWHRMHMREHGPWGEKGPWSEEVPPVVAEWHRRMHGEPPTDEGHGPDAPSGPKQ